MRAVLEWTALAITTPLLVFAGRDFAHARAKSPPPNVVTLDPPEAPPNPGVWVDGAAQAHGLSIVDGYAAWTEGDASVHIAPVTEAAGGTTFEHEGAMVGPILGPKHEACWITARAKLRCAAPHGRADDVAHVPGSAVTMDVDETRVVWTQFDGLVVEAARSTGEVRTLAKTHAPVDVRIDGDVAYVSALEPTRVVRFGAKTEQVVFERTGNTTHLGALLVDRDALYLDTRDDVDGLTSVLRIDKTTRGVTTLYRGYAHVALVALHGETLYALQAPFRDGSLDLQAASVVTLSVHGGALTHVRTSGDLVIGWGGSVAVDDDAIYFAHGPRNPVGARGPIWRLSRREPL